MLNVDGDTIVGYKITTIFQGPRAVFDVDTCPEREVILRIWDPVEIRLVPPLQPGTTHDLISFELSPEEALRLSGKLIEYAHKVMIREIMNS